MAGTPSATGNEDVVRGIGLRIASAGLVSATAALLKLAAEQGAHAPEIMFYRALFGLPVVLVWVFATKGLGALSTQRPLAHLGRTALGIFSILCSLQALVMLPLADATTISFTTPLFATLFSWLILRERIGRHRWLAVACGMLGVLIVLRPGGTSGAIPAVGVAIGLFAALGTAGVNIALRQMRETEHVAAIVFWFFAGSGLVGLILLPFFGRIHDTETMLLLAAGGVAGGLMQITLTASLQSASVSVLAPFDYLQIVGAVVLGWLLLSSVPTLNTLAGAMVISASGLYTVWRERLHQRRRGLASPARMQAPI
jgi:drug/metabolite transporter (DMT)-like permease